MAMGRATECICRHAKKKEGEREARHLAQESHRSSRACVACDGRYHRSAHHRVPASDADGQRLSGRSLLVPVISLCTYERVCCTLVPPAWTLVTYLPHWDGTGHWAGMRCCRARRTNGGNPTLRTLPASPYYAGSDWLKNQKKLNDAEMSGNMVVVVVLG